MEESRPQWTARQMVEAFPWDTMPRYLLRDRAPYSGSSDFRVLARGFSNPGVLFADGFETGDISAWSNTQ